MSQSPLETATYRFLVSRLRVALEPLIDQVGNAALRWKARAGPMPSPRLGGRNRLFAGLPVRSLYRLQLTWGSL